MKKLRYVYKNMRFTHNDAIYHITVSGAAYRRDINGAMHRVKGQELANLAAAFKKRNKAQAEKEA